MTFLAFSAVLSAQSLGYNNNRIAISADGNNQADNHPEAQWPRADPDDWGGTPAALAMLAKQGLQDQLVHYSYNNFIEAPPHTTERNYMAEAVNGAIQRWEFNESLFFDVSENDSLAIKDLADQINKSTTSDPLYFIHMGPSEFFYRAVKHVLDSGITDALSHVQVISHSGYNDNHLRRNAHHTMAEAIALSGNRIKYKKISDQNACDNTNHLWCSGTDFTPFTWMKEHNDPNIQWLWSRLQFHPGGKGADISDAGMVYYLTTGDEYGNLAKFEEFIGIGIPIGPVISVESIILEPDTIRVFTGRIVELDATILPSEAWNKKIDWSSSNPEIAIVSSSGQVQGTGDGVALIIAMSDDGHKSDTTVVEVETLQPCTDISYVGIQDFEMTQIDTFVISYKDVGRNAVAVDASIYKNKFGATRKIFDGVTGFYKISLTSLTEIDGESSYRLRINNELIGEFQNPASSTDYTENVHTWENILVETEDVIQIESNTHSNNTIPEGDAFAFARGRWRSIDFECTGECVVEETDGLLVFEAERFELKGQWKLGYDADKASGGKYIYFSGPNSYQTVNQSNVISHTFRINNPGNYTVKWTMRQPVGERGTDKGNDAWIYLADDRGYAGSVKLEHFEKFYGRSDDNFNLNGTAEVHGLGHKWLTAKFPTAGEYTLNICGRSHGLQIDRLIFFKGMSQDEAAEKIKNIAETSNCGSVVPVEPPPQVYASPKSMVLPYLDKGLAIDGIEEESWFFFAPNSGCFESQGNQLPLSTDLSYSFKAAYDSVNVYFLVSVLDDQKHAYSGSGTDYWNSDHVNLFFNPDNEHEAAGLYGEDALHIRLNYGNDSSLYSGNGSWKGEADHAGFQYAYRDTDEGYMIEVQIPWEGIIDSLGLEEKRQIGFDITVSDMDEGEAPEHTISWANDTEAGDESRDTRKFGTFRLGNKNYPYLDRTRWKVIFVDSESDDPDRALSLKENAIDGDNHTHWHTRWYSEQPPLPHELQIDFRAVYEISDLHYLPRQDEWGPNGTIGAYEIYISNSKDIWGEPIHRSEFDYGADPQKDDFKMLQKVKLDSVVRGRFFKIVALSEAQNDPEIESSCIAELNFLGKYISESVNPGDTISPIILNLPGDIYKETGSESCEATVYWTTPRIRDNYSGATLSADHEPGESFETGSTTVTYTALDAAGNATFGSFNIVVADKGAPVFTSYPENLIDTIRSGDSISVSWDIPEAYDLCGEINLNSSHESGSYFGPGTTEVSYTAEDESGNTSSISFLVQIESPLYNSGHYMNAGIKIYPVPAKNMLFLALPEADETLIRLYSITGTELQRNYCSSTKVEIDVSDLSGGLYMLCIELDDHIYTDKVIIR